MGTGNEPAAATTPHFPNDVPSLTDYFGANLRLYAAEDDASLTTNRIYHMQVVEFTAWFQRKDVSAMTAAEDAIITNCSKLAGAR